MPNSSVPEQNHGRNGRKHQCSQCEYETDRKFNFERHFRTHTGDRPFKCHFCSRRFIQKSARDTHQKTHSRDSSIQDEDVDGGRVGRGVNGQKVYRCSQCVYISDRKYNLKRHKVKHTGERRFSCPHCSRTYSQSSSRNRHLKKSHP